MAASSSVAWGYAMAASSSVAASSSDEALAPAQGEEALASAQSHTAAAQAEPVVLATTSFAPVADNRRRWQRRLATPVEQTGTEGDQVALASAQGSLNAAAIALQPQPKTPPAGSEEASGGQEARSAVVAATALAPAVGPPAQGEEALASVPGEEALAPAQGNTTPAVEPPAVTVQDLTHAGLKEVITKLTGEGHWDVKTAVEHIPVGNRQGPQSWQELVERWPSERVLRSVVATFFEDEPDPNRGDKPRCDFVLTMDDDTWVRYHPQAEPIWSTDRLPSGAMQGRYNRRKNLERKLRRA